MIAVNDAAGGYGGGLYQGNVMRIVPRKYCDQLDQETEDFYANFQESFKNISKVVPFRVQPTVAKYHLVVDGAPPFKITQSICFSKSCSESDLVQILEYNPILGWLSDAVKNVTLEEVRVLDAKLEDDETRSTALFFAM